VKLADEDGRFGAAVRLPGILVESGARQHLPRDLFYF
jgi:hypothetical protein